MNSIKALNRLLVTKTYQDEDRLEYFNIVKKDLETLELLKQDNLIIYLIKKEIYDMQNAYCGNTKEERKRVNDYIERLKKIKEVLEDE